MGVVRQEIRRPVREVYAALTDPYTYPHWLIGCCDIRSVDDDWPAPGTRFHHRVGLGGPVTVADNTKVVARTDDALLALEVRARPFGRGRATFRLSAGGAPGTTVVELEEAPIGLLSPTKPLADPFVDRRNVRSLRKLAEHVEGGGSDDSPGAAGR